MHGACPAISLLLAAPWPCLRHSTPATHADGAVIHARLHAKACFGSAFECDLLPLPFPHHLLLLQTGLPFVDASMRELAATGWMSNRGRQNVANLLTKVGLCCAALCCGCAVAVLVLCGAVLCCAAILLLIVQACTSTGGKLSFFPHFLMRRGCTSTGGSEWSCLPACLWTMTGRSTPPTGHTTQARKSR